MVRPSAGAFIALCLWLNAPLGVGAQMPTRPLAERSVREATTLSPGLEYIELGANGDAETDPWSARLLKIDLTRFRLDVVLATDQITGQEATSSAVERLGAVAGVNGGFSVTNDPGSVIRGDPDGLLVVDGAIVSDPGVGRPSMALCDGTGAQALTVVRPGLDLSVWRSRIELSGPWGLNRAREADDLVVYTSVWGSTTLTGPDGVEVQVRGGRVTDVREGGSTPIPDNGLVLSGSGARGAELARVFAEPPDDPSGSSPDVSVRMTLRDVDRGMAPVALSGCDFTTAGPVIASEGRVRTDYSDESFYRESFVVGRHPRTAVGIEPDGRTLHLFVIDGRQEGYSAGATLEELASLMLAEGAWMVYNLDGGGSTTMAIGGRGVVNRPSDPSERPRSDVVLVFPRGGG